MVFEEKTIDSEYVFKGKLINVKRDIVTTVNGESVREVEIGRASCRERV